MLGNKAFFEFGLNSYNFILPQTIKNSSRPEVIEKYVTGM